jgi:hypothetical protein
MHVAGGWSAANDIPPSKGLYGSFNEVGDRNKVCPKSFHMVLMLTEIENHPQGIEWYLDQGC